MPVYRQLVESIRDDVVQGRLKIGQRMPTVRSLADELGISRLTVHRAYQNLVESGILRARQGSGTFVAPGKMRKESAEEIESFPLIQFAERINDAPAYAAPISPLVPDCTLADLRGFYADQLTFASKERGMNHRAEWQGEHDLRQSFASVAQQIIPSATLDRILVHPHAGIPTFLDCVVPFGAPVLVQTPGAQRFQELAKQGRFRPVPFCPSKSGMNDVEAAFRDRGVKAALVCSAFGWGDGTAWSNQQRSEFMRLCLNYGVEVYEFAAYHHLSFSEDPALALEASAPMVPVWTDVALDAMISPGLPLSCLVVPEHRLATLHAHRIWRTGAPRAAQKAQATYLRQEFKMHLAMAKQEYRSRARRFVSNLRAALRYDIALVEPQGGYTLTLKTPKAIPYDKVNGRLTEMGVHVFPGIGTSNDLCETVRISYSTIDKQAIAALAPRIARMFNRFVEA